MPAQFSSNINNDNKYSSNNIIIITTIRFLLIIISSSRTIFHARHASTDEKARDARDGLRPPAVSDEKSDLLLWTSEGEIYV